MVTIGTLSNNAVHPTSVRTTVIMSSSPTAVSPVQKNSTGSNIILIAASLVAATVIGIVVMAIVCTSLIARRKAKSFKLSPRPDKQIENASKVSIHVQDVVDKLCDIEGTRKRHVSPMMVGSKDTLQYDQPQVTTSKQASPGPDPTTKPASEEHETIHIFTVTDDDKPVGMGESHGNDRYNIVVTATLEQARPGPTLTVSPWPVRGKRMVEPYSSVTLTRNFSFQMKRNKAYGSMKDIADEAADEATANNTEDDDNDYDDIL